MFKSKEVKEIYVQNSPLLYKLNYMLYSCVLGAAIMYAYVTSQGGAMPEAGSFWDFAVSSWKWFAGPVVGPILVAAFNHWRGIITKKRRSTD